MLGLVGSPLLGPRFPHCNSVILHYFTRHNLGNRKTGEGRRLFSLPSPTSALYRLTTKNTTTITATTSNLNKLDSLPARRRALFYSTSATAATTGNTTGSSSSGSPGRDSQKGIFITTPIFYVNAAPHVGHLHSMLVSDALARWMKFCNHTVFFSTGTDEHGQKIQQSAIQRNMEPQAFCDEVSSLFRKLATDFHIEYDAFIRTTDSKHKQVVMDVWHRLQEKGFIYKAEYEGWYSVTAEAFQTDENVEEIKIDEKNSYFQTKDTKERVEWIREENYMFRLSKFAESILDWLQSNSEALKPVSRRNEVLSMLNEGLNDLSISRPTKRVRWGITVPKDPDHTIYVWLDALFNYLTVSDYPLDGKCPSKFPPTFQIIGKDILKFHTIFWPAFLMALGLPLPKHIVCHGHWLVEGVKMSKSKGNIVDPLALLETHSVDSIRFFLLNESKLGYDSSFSESLLEERYNAYLANQLGNMVMRCVGLCKGKSITHPKEFLSFEGRRLMNAAESLIGFVDATFQDGEFSRGIELILSFLQELNTYFTNEAPWKLRKLEDDESVQRFNCVLYTAMESLRLTSLFLHPIIPTSAHKILDDLNIPLEFRTFESIFQRPPQFSPRKITSPVFPRLQ